MFFSEGDLYLELLLGDIEVSRSLWVCWDNFYFVGYCIIIVYLYVWSVLEMNLYEKFC